MIFTKKEMTKLIEYLEMFRYFTVTQFIKENPNFIINNVLPKM